MLENINVSYNYCLMSLHGICLFMFVNYNTLISISRYREQTVVTDYLENRRRNSGVTRDLRAWGGGII